MLKKRTKKCISWSSAQTAVADPECARRGGLSHILAEKGVLASLYSKKCVKMQYFHKEGGGGVRPMLNPPLNGPPSSIASNLQDHLISDLIQNGLKYIITWAGFIYATRPWCCRHYFIPIHLELIFILFIKLNVGFSISSLKSHFHNDDVYIKCCVLF